MFVVKRVARRMALPAVTLAGLLLAGCSSGHIGDSWQCPLATGGACDSVAAADPAVPDAKAGKAMAPGQPLWLPPRESRADAAEAPPTETRTCASDCRFDPLEWLTRLLGIEDNGGNRAGKEPDTAGEAGPEEAPVPAASVASDVLPEPDASASSSSPAASRPEPVTAAPAAAETASGDDDAENNTDLRTGEAVARIWIAPFVDAGGIYREAAWVRVVLEPAGWRLK